MINGHASFFGSDKVIDRFLGRLDTDSHLDTSKMLDRGIERIQYDVEVPLSGRGVADMGLGKDDQRSTFRVTCSSFLYRVKHVEALLIRYKYPVREVDGRMSDDRMSLIFISRR